MFTYGLIILLLTIKRGESVEENKIVECDDNALMPGLIQFKRGIDITKLDLMSLGPGAENGLKSPIVHYTCNEGTTIQFPPTEGEKSYENKTLPDQISAVTPKRTSSSSEKVEIMKTCRDVRNVMKANAGIGDILGLFSLSGSYEKMTSSVTKKSVYLESAEHVESVFSVLMKPAFSRKMKLDEDAADYIEDLPTTFKEDPEKYQTFIDYYGTHYFSEATFGGVIEVLLETSTDYYEKTSDSKVQAEAKATFKAIMIGGSSSRGSKKVDEEFTKNTAKTIRVHGGTTNLFNEDKGFKDWKSTVPGLPYLYKGKLKPIYDFFKDDDKKDAMERAIKVHMDKAQLKAARKLAKAKLKSIKGDAWGKAEKLQGYLATCDDLIGQNDPDENEVKRLSEKIEEALTWVKISGLCTRTEYREYPCQNGFRVGCVKKKGECWRMCKNTMLGVTTHYGWAYVKHQNGADMRCSTDTQCVQKGAGSGRESAICLTDWLGMDMAIRRSQKAK